MLEDLPKTYATVTRFPDGDVKISGCFRPHASGRARTRKIDSELERQQRAAKRAASELRDLAKFFQLSYLLTLTYRGPVFDRLKVQRDFKKFLRVVRLSLPDFFCISVLEYHKGGGANEGGIHLHMATDRYHPVDVLRKAWWGIVGDAQGNIQIEHRSFKDSFRRVGSYLAKYVSKDFDSLPREFGQHRYLRSRALRVVREKLLFLKGMYREHLSICKTMLIFESRSQTYHFWQSEDGFQFCFKSYP